MLTIGFLLSFLILVGTLWPEGYCWISENIFIPSRACVVFALDEFEDSVIQGQSLVKAFGKFIKNLSR